MEAVFMFCVCKSFKVLPSQLDLCNDCLYTDKSEFKTQFNCSEVKFCNLPYYGNTAFCNMVDKSNREADKNSDIKDKKQL